MKKVMLTASAAVLLSSASVYASEGKFFFRLLPGASFNFFETEVEFNVPQGIADTNKKEIDTKTKKEGSIVKKVNFKKDNGIKSIVGVSGDLGYYVSDQFRVALSIGSGFSDYYNIDKKIDDFKISSTDVDNIKSLTNAMESDKKAKEDAEKKHNEINDALTKANIDLDLAKNNKETAENTKTNAQTVKDNADKAAEAAKAANDALPENAAEGDKQAAKAKLEKATADATAAASALQKATTDASAANTNYDTAKGVVDSKKSEHDEAKKVLDEKKKSYDNSNKEVALAKTPGDLGKAITEFANSGKIVVSSYSAFIVGEYDVVDSSFCKVFVGGGPGASLVNSHIESDSGKFNELKRVAVEADKIAKEKGDDKSTAKIQAGQGNYVNEKDQKKLDIAFSGKAYLGISKQFTPIVHGEVVAGYTFKGKSDIIAKAVDDKWYVKGTDGKNKLTHHNVNVSVGVRIDI